MTKQTKSVVKPFGAQIYSVVHSLVLSQCGHLACYDSQSCLTSWPPSRSWIHTGQYILRYRPGALQWQDRSTRNSSAKSWVLAYALESKDLLKPARIRCLLI